MIYELRLENRMTLQNLLEYSGWIGMSAVQTFSTSRMHFYVCSTNWDDIRVSSPTNTEPQIDTMISATRRIFAVRIPGLKRNGPFDTSLLPITAHGYLSSTDSLLSYSSPLSSEAITIR
jgi:hypothetical protein